MYNSHRPPTPLWWTTDTVNEFHNICAHLSIRSRFLIHLFTYKRGPYPAVGLNMGYATRILLPPFPFRDLRCLLHMQYCDILLHHKWIIQEPFMVVRCRCGFWAWDSDIGKTRRRAGKIPSCLFVLKDQLVSLHPGLFSLYIPAYGILAKGSAYSWALTHMYPWSSFLTFERRHLLSNRSLCIAIKIRLLRARYIDCGLPRLVRFQHRHCP